MMIPNRVLAALLIFLQVVTLGCSGGVGRMAEKLDRPTALALLKEKEEELLINVARQHTWYVSPVVLEATVYRPIPGGFGSTPEEEEARLIANMHGELAQRNALVDVGLLKRQADKDTQESTYETGYEKFTRYVYYFSVVAQPGVSFTQATEGCRSTECRGNASFALAKPAFTSVTGVLQRGIEAEVEAQVTYGPTTLYAMLNTLQMGFRTLAIEHRSAEVWQVLGAVKTEFARFGEWIGRVREQVGTVSRTLEQADTRTRQMQRKLRDVEALPAEQAVTMLPPAPRDDEEEE